MSPAVELTPRTRTLILVERVLDARYLEDDTAYLGAMRVALDELDGVDFESPDFNLCALADRILRRCQKNFPLTVACNPHAARASSRASRRMPLLHARAHARGTLTPS